MLYMNDIIKSKDNDKIKQTAKLLKSASYRNETGLLALEGVRLCIDAIQSGAECVYMFYTQKAALKIDEFINENSYEVREDVFEKISDTKTSQGVVCVFKCRDIDFIIDKNGKYIALENINDPANLGAIARTAEALGINGIVILGECCDIHNPKALRASMGAILRLPVLKTDCESFISMCKKNGIKTYAAALTKHAVPINEADFTKGSCVLIGNEANGLQSSTIESCDFSVVIPMNDNANSLNAAAAAAVFAFAMKNI